MIMFIDTFLKFQSVSNNIEDIYNLRKIRNYIRNFVIKIKYESLSNTLYYLHVTKLI